MVKADEVPAADDGAVNVPSSTPVSGDAMELVERLRRMARVGGHGLEKLVAEAADEIERLRSQGGAPEGWAHVPAIGTYVEADHPITCINPTKAFEVRFVNSVRGHWLVRGDNTCWFDVNSVKPATRENAIAAEEAAMLSAAPQPPEGGTGWPELPCRFSERGCTGHAVGIFHVPQGCHCWPDPIQALCAQHACKADSPGPIECVIDFSCASPPGQDDRTNDGSETDGGLNEDLVLVPSEIVDRFPEINPSNYDHDDACALNAWGVELVLAAKPMSALPRKDVEGADSEDRPPGTYITIRLDDDKAGIAPGRVQVTYLSTQGEDL